MSTKIPAMGVYLDMDIIPVSETLIPQISKESWEILKKGINALQEEKGLKVIFCLTSEENNPKNLQKGINIYNILVDLFPYNNYSLGSMRLNYNYYFHVLKLDKDISSQYPDHQIMTNAYFCQEKYLEMTSGMIETPDFMIIKGNSIEEWGINITNIKKRQKSTN